MARAAGSGRVPPTSGGSTIPPYAVTGRSPTTTSECPLPNWKSPPPSPNTKSVPSWPNSTSTPSPPLSWSAPNSVATGPSRSCSTTPRGVVDAQLAGHVVERGRRRGVELLARGRVERHARGLAHQAGVVTCEDVGAMAAPEDVTGVGLVGERRAADEVVLVVVALEPVTVLVALDEVVVGVALDQVGAALAEHPVVLVVADHEVAAGDEVESPHRSSRCRAASACGRRRPSPGRPSMCSSSQGRPRAR